MLPCAPTASINLFCRYTICIGIDVKSPLLATLDSPRFSATSSGITSAHFVGLDLHMYYEFCIISPPDFITANHPNARLP